MLQDPNWLEWAVGHETTQQVPEVVAGRGQWVQEQPVPGRNGSVPQVAAADQEGQ